MMSGHGLMHQQETKEQLLYHNIDDDVNVSIKSIFILALTLERQRLCCFGNTTVFNFLLLCRHTQAHTGLMLTCLLTCVFSFLPFVSFFLYSLRYCLLFPFSHFFLMLFYISPHEYAIQ